MARGLADLEFDLLRPISGKTDFMRECLKVRAEEWPKDTLIYPRKGSGRQLGLGRVRGHRRCQLEGCTGIQVNVAWPSGNRTWVCTKGLETWKRGYRIV